MILWLQCLNKMLYLLDYRHLIRIYQVYLLILTACYSDDPAQLCNTRLYLLHAYFPLTLWQQITSGLKYAAAVVCSPESQDAAVSMESQNQARTCTLLKDGN
jgi:hypothetical protein